MKHLAHRCWLASATRQMILLLSLSLTAVHAYAEDWVYSVKSGDTLWHLCLEFTTKKNCWIEIGPYNNVDYPRSLAPGTRIRFPIAWLKAQPVAAKILFVRGSVLKSDTNNMASAAIVGDSLAMGSKVVTDNNSTATLLFADGATLSLESNSEVHLDTLTQHGATGMVDTRLNLITGAAKSRVPKRTPNSQFSVSTPSAIAAVRGTDFRVSSQQNKMLGEVFEGTIEVAKPSSKPKQAGPTESIKLPEHFGVFVEQGKPIGDPVALLDPVTWSDDLTNVALPYVLRWQPLVSAITYKVELIGLSDAKEVLWSAINTDVLQTLPEDITGCFVARVSAIDAIGLQGMPADKTLCAELPLPQVSQLAKAGKKLSWQAVENADQYRVEASADNSFSEPVIIAQTKATTMALLSDHNGQYFRVIPIDIEGRLGQPSNPVQIRLQNNQGIIAAIVFFIILAL